MDAFIKANSLLSKFQNGFRAGHNTLTSVIPLLNFIYNNLDSGYHVAAVFLDLSKAFDSIDHSILLEKLHNLYNFSHSATTLLHSYLSRRFFSVRYKSATSEHKQLETGVPQDSILGPLLFNLYINDLVYHIEDDMQVLIYADDTVIFTASRNPSDLETKINACLENIHCFCNTNRLKINISKTKFIHFRPQKSLTCTISVSLDAAFLDEVSTYKYLGFFIEQDLQMTENCNRVCTKLKLLWCAVQS